MTNYAINRVDPIYRMLFEREDAGRGTKDGLPKIAHNVVASFKGREVFKKLGITTSFPGETLFHSIENYLSAAKKHPIISQSYGNVSRVDKNGKQGVVVSMNKLDEKNGARYMRMLLIYAFKLGALRNGKDLRVQHVGNKLVIYHSRQGKANPKRQPDI